MSKRPSGRELMGAMEGTSCWRHQFLGLQLPRALDVPACLHRLTLHEVWRGQMLTEREEPRILQFYNLLYSQCSGENMAWGGTEVGQGSEGQKRTLGKHLQR